MSADAEKLVGEVAHLAASNCESGDCGVSERFPPCVNCVDLARAAVALVLRRAAEVADKVRLARKLDEQFHPFASAVLDDVHDDLESLADSVEGK